MEYNKKTLFSKNDIDKRIKEIAAELNEIYNNEEIIIISLLRGSFMFTADLVRELKSLVAVEFMVTSSYGDNEVSTGNVEILLDHRLNIQDKNVLIVDDIIDSGNTLKKVYEHLLAKGPKSLKTCVLLDKPSRRLVDFKPDYCGFEIPDYFVVGYGLNYGKHYRNEPEVFVFEKD